MRGYARASVAATVALAGGLFLVTVGGAHAGSACQAGGVGDPSGAVSANPGYNDGTPGSSGGLQVCTNGGGNAGTLTVSGHANDPTNPTGYAVVDGANTNSGPGAGYVGVERDNQGTVAVVGSSDPVDYDPGDSQGEANEGTKSDTDNDTTSAQPSGYGDNGHDHHQDAGVGTCPPQGSQNTPTCETGPAGPSVFVNP